MGEVGFCGGYPFADWVFATHLVDAFDFVYFVFCFFEGVDVHDVVLRGLGGLLGEEVLVCDDVGKIETLFCVGLLQQCFGEIKAGRLALQ